MVARTIDGLDDGGTLLSTDMFAIARPTEAAVEDQNKKYSGASLLALVRSSHPGYVSGNWYPAVPNIGAITAQSGAVANGTAKFIPIRIFHPVTISDLGAFIVAASAGGNIQLAIYANSAAGRPTGSELAKTGNLSTTGAGAPITGDITGSNVTLQPGYYWSGINADNGTATCVTLDQAGVNASALYGGTMAEVLTGASATTFHLTTTLTFGTWGDLTAASWTVANTRGGALLYFLVA